MKCENNEHRNTDLDNYVLSQLLNSRHFTAHETGSQNKMKNPNEKPEAKVITDAETATGMTSSQHCETFNKTQKKSEKKTVTIT